MTQPAVYMIAGPNGAGKTTAAMKLLPDFLSIHEFINADEMARGLNPLNPDGQAMVAGRLMLERMDSLIAASKNFAFESTGASHVFADKLKQSRMAGYRLGLVYLWLPNAELAKRRVAWRVAQGGHRIADKDIMRRYQRGLRNLVRLYLPIVDQAVILDNTLPVTDAPDVIARKHDDQWEVYNRGIWSSIEKQAQENDQFE